MSLFGTINNSVSALQTAQIGLQAVGNNIANANAKGFKRDRAEFEDLLSLDVATGSGPAQIGRGSRLRDIRTMHAQGGLTVTDNLTDLAVQGMGFFVLSPRSADVNETNSRLYTRVGSFVFDRDGYLSDSLGARVQGYTTNNDGVISTRLGDMRIETNSIPPEATKKLNMSVNLDALSKILPEEFDLNRPEVTSNFNNTISVFDSQGTAHQITTYFRRIEDSEGISFEWHATVDGKEVADPDSDFPIKEIANGKVRFSPKGLLLEETTNNSEVNFAGGAAPGQLIEFDFGKNIGSEGGNGVNSSSSIASKSITNYHSQNGYEAGNIKALRVQLDGTLLGVFTNGVTKPLGAVALATFENQDGLMKGGHNVFYATIDSGPAKIGMAQTGTRGTIYASSLEESNVDLATEFVSMIMTQRGFQANSRSITTTDSLYEEVISLKR